MPQEERGKGSAGAASYSGTQSLAPLAGQNSVKIAPKSAGFVMRQKSLELVAARRDGERKCRIRLFAAGFSRVKGQSFAKSEEKRSNSNGVDRF